MGEGKTKQPTLKLSLWGEELLFCGTPGMGGFKRTTNIIKKKNLVKYEVWGDPWKKLFSLSLANKNTRGKTCLLIRPNTHHPKRRERSSVGALDVALEGCSVENSPARAAARWMFSCTPSTPQSSALIHGWQNPHQLAEHALWGANAAEHLTIVSTKPHCTQHWRCLLPGSAYPI